jgi:hypothetical protein
MNVGVFVRVEVRQAIDDGAWLLGGGGVVEPHQRVTVDLLGENRKIAAYRGHVKLPAAIQPEEPERVGSELVRERGRRLVRERSGAGLSQLEKVEAWRRCRQGRGR